MFGYNKNDTTQQSAMSNQMNDNHSHMGHRSASDSHMSVQNTQQNTAFPSPPPQINGHMTYNSSPLSLANETLLTSGATNDDLINLRQEALNTLRPLLKNLHLPPAEMFKVMLRLIQSADDPSLIPSAYEIALSIEDDDEKAQSLLDIVNEINYFTKKQVN